MDRKRKKRQIEDVRLVNLSIFPFLYFERSLRILSFFPFFCRHKEIFASFLPLIHGIMGLMREELLEIYTIYGKKDEMLRKNRHISEEKMTGEAVKNGKKDIL